MSKRPFTSSITHRKARGFALLITITLLAFLVLLLVSLASLTRVETQVAINNQSISQARQNALMALNIALGQLQKHTAPDQRVTASSDVLIPTGVAATHAAIDTYWSGSRNRHWTGAWKNGNTRTYDSSVVNSPKLFNPEPELLAWLVSGNEKNPDDFKPGDAISSLTAATSATDEIKDASGRSYRLLVKNTAHVIDAPSLHRAVAAPQVVIESATVPGLTGSVPVGHYAWWIGDEGVKARSNLTDTYASDTTDEGKIRRFQAAQRPAIEAMTIGNPASATGNAETDGLAPYYKPNDPALASIFDRAQFALTQSSTVYPGQLKQRFHDLTVSSSGVLADVKNGGLKRDLSYLLGQPTAADFRTALNAAFDNGVPAPKVASATSIYNPALSPVFTPYATLPPDADPAKPYSGPNGIINYGPTWEQLRSFHNLGNLTTASPAGIFDGGRAIPQRQTGEQHGIAPLLIQGKVFYRLRIVGGTAIDDGTGVYVNRTGSIWIDAIPMVVLANPYNVDVGPADYTVRFEGSQPMLRFGNDVAPASPKDAFPAIPSTLTYTQEGNQNQNLPRSFTGITQLVLRSTGMAAGEAQIFSIDPDMNTTDRVDPERIEVKSRTDSKIVYLTNEYDTSQSLTYNTQKTIPADKRYAALFSSGAELQMALYMNYDQTLNIARLDERLVRYMMAQSVAGLGGASEFFLVNPTSEGEQQGGGYLFSINEAPTPVLAGQKEKKLPQQAPFYQVNYRSIQLIPTGDSSGSKPSEWARTYAKNGSTGGPGTSANPYLKANFLTPSANSKIVRWGLVNMGDLNVNFQSSPPSSIGGPSAGTSPDAIGFKNILYDLPQPGHPLASLGQLQHFNTGGHIDRTNGVARNHASNQVHGWQVNYPISNSYPHPRTPRDKVISYTNAVGYHYDGSYLWNEALWDRFYFSTYPALGTFNFATQQLVNQRYRPFRPRSEVAWDDATQFRGADNTPSTAANSRKAAENLLVAGAFNINSTSVEAWKAVLSSLRNVPVGTESVGTSTANPNLTAPFSRTIKPLGGANGAETGIVSNAWNGVRNLTQTQINDLAEAIVLQVRRRGPFLSLAEFVNRRLIAPADDTFKLGLGGALQTALDTVVNLPANIPNSPAQHFRITAASNAGENQLVDQDYLMSTGLNGFPGHLLQGDVLSALGATLGARSDTFVIRTYGDAVNPVTASVEGRAWCEATVQRIPDYVVPKSGSTGNAPYETPVAGSPNETFGRRYKIVSFRWLSPDDI